MTGSGGIGGQRSSERGELMYAGAGRPCVAVLVIPDRGWEYFTWRHVLYLPCPWLAELKAGLGRKLVGVTGSGSSRHGDELIEMQSMFSGKCKCGRAYKKGERIFWSPNKGARCFHCGRGRDPVEMDLSEEDKQQIQTLTDRIQRLGGLPKPLKPNLQEQFDEALLVLARRYAKVAKVKKVLEQHGDAVKVLLSSMESAGTEQG